MFCPKVPQDQWSEHKYAVRLTIPRESKTQTLFYFCHIHRLIDLFCSSGININSSVEWVGWSKWRIQQNQLLFWTSSFKVSTRTNIMQHSPILMLCAAPLRWSYSLLKLWDNISIFTGQRLPWEEGSILPKYELPLREGRQPSVLKMHGSHRLQGFPPFENIFTCSLDELRVAWFSSRLYKFRRSKSKHSDELWDESRGAQQPTGRLHAPDDPPPRECRQHGKVGRTTVRLLRD